MKKITALLLAVLTLLVFAPAAPAAGPPEITSQPASVCYNEGGVAVYTVDAKGSSLSYEWHIVYGGSDYKLPGTTGDWVQYVGEGFGISKDGKMLYFQGVEAGLGGAFVYCIVSNSLGSETSNYASVYVGSDPDMPPPPSITVPAYVSAQEGETVSLTCSVSTGNVGQYDGPWLEYEWHKLKANALVGGSEIVKKTSGIVSDTSFTCQADTSQAGIYYYVCKVSDGKDGSVKNVSYSGIVTVEVLEKEEIVDIEITGIPGKKEYKTGESPDLNGLRVRVYTNMGFYDTEDFTRFAVSPSVFSAAGTQDVTISLEGHTDSFSVNVSGEEPEEQFKITKQPQSVTADEGKMVSFRCGCNTEAAYSWGIITPDGTVYYWINEAKFPVQGTQTDTLTVEATKELNGAVFFCGITPEDGEVRYTSQAILKVNVNDEPVDPVDPPKPGGNGNTLLIAVICVLAAIVIVLAVLLVRSRKNEAPARNEDPTDNGDEEDGQDWN